ncbi:hypothetical protein VB716_10395 [Synechococcus sp. CCY9201]|nr:MULTISPECIES: hypothetical protein [unclassified Synechococcus]MEA5423669.1 hypothetical protein [Synechococcus sp. CCY9202]MEA5474628.1 hypothetical protein [Synechococcus sp. CCY9201]
MRGLDCSSSLVPHGRDGQSARDLNEQAFEGIKVAAPDFTDAAVIRLLITGQHAERQILVAGVKQPHRQPLRGSLRLHPRIKALLPAGILGQSGDQDL